MGLTRTKKLIDLIWCNEIVTCSPLDSCYIEAAKQKKQYSFDCHNFWYLLDCCSFDWFDALHTLYVLAKYTFMIAFHFVFWAVMPYLHKVYCVPYTDSFFCCLFVCHSYPLTCHTALERRRQNTAIKHACMHIRKWNSRICFINIECVEFNFFLSISPSRSLCCRLCFVWLFEALLLDCFRVAFLSLASFSLHRLQFAFISNRTTC